MNRAYTIIKKIKHFANSTFFRTFAPYMEKSANDSNTSKKRLLGLTTAELKQVAQQLGMPAFTGGQIAKWLYEKGVMSIDEMTNLSKQNRERLSNEYCVGAMPPIDCQRSVDGTIKYLFPVLTTQFSPLTSQFVETVFIPDGDRATLCVSSQVGCKMNCLFCQTGKQGFEGNLSAADILNQIYALPERDQLTNVVFMGQGEPMDNLDNVLSGRRVCLEPQAYHGEQRGREEQAEALPRREPVSRSHLHALAPARAAPVADACRESHEHQ